MQQAIRHFPIHCAFALASLSAQAAGQWSNDYVVPQDTAPRQATTPRWSESLNLPQPAAPQPPPRAQGKNHAFAQLCRSGNRVEAKSAGQWYEARILGADARAQTCDVTYVGFGKHYDETVNLDRIRPYTGNVTAPPKPAAGPPNAAGAAQGAPAFKVPICSSVARSDGMGNTSYCH